MDKPVTIINREWSNMTKQVENNTDDIENHEKRLNQHRSELNELRKANIELPLAIQKAVEKGLNPVMEKMLSYEEKFKSIELNKIQEELNRTKEREAERKERDRYFKRTILTAFITSTVSGVVGFYIAVFLNNIGG